MIYKNHENTMNIVSGWGRNKSANVKIIKPLSSEKIENLIVNSKKNSIISRGLGRSYGDAAQLNNGSVFDLQYINHINLNAKKGIVTAGSGVRLDDLLKIIVPQGFFIPVSPGTRYVTIGGAIASDVHGKNHHLRGSFGNHIHEITLVDGLGKFKKLSGSENASTEEKSQFWATIGGMGLTGVIIEATFSLIPIKTSLIISDVFRYKDLDNLMDAMIKTDDDYEYSVAWVDSLSRSNKGVLTGGNHAVEENINNYIDPIKNLSYESNTIASVPSFFPNRVLNKYTVKAFNEIWFRKTPTIKKDCLNSLGNFFHPLDGINNWNKLYGSKGFIQYQFVVPDNESRVVSQVLDIIRKVGVPSFLTVLKRFGPENNAFLSFPMRGWTLAIDIPVSLHNLNETLLKIDKKVSNAGGRIYLAKDSKQTKEMFENTYNRLGEWKDIKRRMDPNNIFCSDLSKRLGIY